MLRYYPDHLTGRSREFGTGAACTWVGTHQPLETTTPFGRMTYGSGGINMGRVGIENIGALQRPREIRDELRRRAGQH